MRSAVVLVLLAVLAMVDAQTGLRCVFLHGQGQLGPKGGGKLYKSLPAYWGRLDKRIGSLCATQTYLWTDTQTRGWDNLDLQKEFCNVIKNAKADVVIAHSMGNLVLGGAVINRVDGCNNFGTDATNVHWYSAQGPFTGSVVATLGTDLCPNPAIEAIGGLFKLCKKNSLGKGVPSDSINSLLPKNVPTRMQEIATKQTSGSMCGVVGLNLPAQSDDGPLAWSGKGLLGAALAISNDVAKMRYPNVMDWSVRNKIDSTPKQYGADGLVAFESCRTAPWTSYKKDPTNALYQVDGNHADGTCRFGDDPKMPSFQACGWMVNMIKRSQTAKAGKQTSGYEAQLTQPAKQVTTAGPKDPITAVNSVGNHINNQIKSLNNEVKNAVKTVNQKIVTGGGKVSDKIKAMDGAKFSQIFEDAQVIQSELDEFLNDNESELEQTEAELENEQSQDEEEEAEEETEEEEGEEETEEAEEAEEESDA